MNWFFVAHYDLVAQGYGRYLDGIQKNLIQELVLVIVGRTEAELSYTFIQSICERQYWKQRAFEELAIYYLTRRVWILKTVRKKRNLTTWNAQPYLFGFFFPFGRV